MKYFLKILLLVGLAIPVQSFATFNSDQELFAAFAQAGYKNVIAMPGGNSAPDIRMLAIDKSGSIQEQQLIDFSTSNSRAETYVPELNYLYNTKAFLASNRVARAYKVANVLLCYRLELNKVEQFFDQSNNYIDCYIFPRNIDEIILSLKALRSIK